MSYNKQYLRCKTKYLELKNNLDGNSNKNGYYIIHRTKNVDNLFKILKDDIMKRVKDVEKKRRHLGGPDPSDYVYGNIYFDDIKNIPSLGAITLIFHPDIINKYGTIFYRLWAINS